MTSDRSRFNANHISLPLRATMEMKSFSLSRSCLWTLLLLLNHLVAGDLLEEPSQKWVYTLEGAALKKGNAVVANKDGNRLFVTADDGSLHILHTDDSPLTSQVFVPESLSGRSTECRSGVAFVEEEDEEGNESSYLVYAVVDTPSSGNSTQVSSRVIAVNLDGGLRWSLSVDGIVAGTPVPGEMAAIIYISRNVDNKGYLSVILVSSSIPELTASFESEDDAPLSPPGVGEGIDGDVVVVAESWDDGFSEDGGIYFLTASKDFEKDGGRGIDSYEFKLVNDWPFSAVAPPLVQESSFWVGGTGAHLSGWAANDVEKVLEGKKDEAKTKWTFESTPSDEDSLQPLLSTPAISSDGSQLFFSGASSGLYSVEAEKGKEVWTDEEEGSEILAQPKVFESGGEAVVYVIEALNGRIRQHDMDKGERNWEYDLCTGNEENVSCESVEAEFSLSPTGNVVYYGDISGRIVALEVANFETQAPTATISATPTVSPTTAPTLTYSPTTVTGKPTISPSIAPVDVEAPATSPSSALIGDEGEIDETKLDDSNVLAIIVGVVVVGLLLLVIIPLMVRRRRNGGGKKGWFDDDSSDDSDLEAPPPPEIRECSDDGSNVLGGVEVIRVRSSPDEEIPQKLAPLEEETPLKPASKKALSPDTPQTADIYIEDGNDEGSVHSNTSVVLLDDEDAKNDERVAEDLMKKFELIAEAQTFEEKSDDDALVIAEAQTFEASNVTTVEKGAVGQSKDGTHLELAVGNNELNPAPADIPISETETSRPSTPVVSQDISAQEEKKEGDKSPTPAMQISSNANASPQSTSSSLYLSDEAPVDGSNENAVQPTSSPDLSPNVFDDLLDSDVPEDEAMALGTTTRERFISMQQPKLSHEYNTRNTSKDADAPDDEVAAPGAHYMATASPPSNFEQMKEEKEPMKKEELWGTFMQDLEAAEEKFLNPTAVQAAPILQYDDQSVESDDPSI